MLNTSVPVKLLVAPARTQFVLSTPEEPAAKCGSRFTVPEPTTEFAKRTKPSARIKFNVAPWATLKVIAELTSLRA